MSKRIMLAEPLGRERIERIAQSVLKDFSPKSLEKLGFLDVEMMYETYIPKRFGIATGYQELTAGVHGYTSPAHLESAVSLSLVESDDQSTIRFGRSTICHEIGHCVLHAHQFKRRNQIDSFLHDKTHPSEQKLFRREEIKPYMDPEWQAWWFCKAILLPKELIKNEVYKGSSIKQIANMVNLNPAFIEVRLKNLSLTGKVKAF